jgi:hypothetical protein
MELTGDQKHPSCYLVLKDSGFLAALVCAAGQWVSGRRLDDSRRTTLAVISECRKGSSSSALWYKLNYTYIDFTA